MNDDAVSAVVLAAGEGRRLEPLTNRRPKPMVPVANQPILEHVVAAIADAGVERIVLVVGYQQERIRNHFGDGDDWDIDIEYVVQDKQLGTAHAVLQAQSAISSQFLVLNGDRLVETSLVERVRDEIESGNGPVMTVTRSKHASDYGVVTVADGRVTDITEKPAPPVTSELINAGVYGFDPSIFDALRSTPTERGELAITTTLKRITEDRPIQAVRYRGRWLDVSHLWDLLDVNASVIDETDTTDAEERREASAIANNAVLGSDVTIGANATIGGSTSIGNNVTIKPNAVVSNAVVFPDAVIESGAVVQDAIVAENARVGANTTITGEPTTMVVDGEVHEGIDLGGVVGDNAVIGNGGTVEPGTVLGDGATVDHGVSVGGRIETDAIVRRG
ncbi:sugar phosphate nucleotidyltransferase [Halopiger xanaduensis]|uniref:Bifunctional protein GlmU n=1 Tax=Halopiger xanaduensis (strain DSM 18323 / JCM 14033 / SH-6) TaxID=797210 RepID=F8DAQ2_HALXS|nr:sugar phosphate nucleotidyltransferase [Halopiger xanaduensis]AEH36994.1 Glucosamine-1-phosphate N-acetyltransferase [Halopiger xanaduensis SH-6]